MGMAVEDHVARVAVDRLLEAARAQEREDLRRLALDRLLDRRVVEHGDPGHPAQPRERRLELQRLVHRLVDEDLDDLLSPGAERPLAEAAAEALRPRRTRPPRPRWRRRPAARTPASPRIFLISSCLPPSKSWLPSTAMTGMLIERWISRASSCASSGRPWSVRSPQSSSTSASLPARDKHVPHGRLERLGVVEVADRRDAHRSFPCVITSILSPSHPPAKFSTHSCQSPNLVRLFALVALREGHHDRDRSAEEPRPIERSPRRLSSSTAEAMTTLEKERRAVPRRRRLRVRPLHRHRAAHQGLRHLRAHPRDFDRALDGCKRDGLLRPSGRFPHWLAKGYRGEDFVDVIFSSGNGVARVDDALVRARGGRRRCSACPSRLSPAEEMIWSKAFIMERERFDGADVAHLLRARAEETRLGPPAAAASDANWRVLLGHLVLFGYIYPGEAANGAGRGHGRADRAPAPAARGSRPPASVSAGARSSPGRSTSWTSSVWGYQDARLRPVGNMSAEEVEIWTAGRRGRDRAVVHGRGRGLGRLPAPIEPGDDLLCGLFPHQGHPCAGQGSIR